MFRLIAFTLLLLPKFSFCQNWNLVNPDYQYTYELVGQENIDLLTIKVDSIINDASENILLLNRIRSLESVIHNSTNYPQWLGREAIIDTLTNTWFFQDTIQFQLKPQSEIGESWVFDLNTNDTVKVINKLETILFNQSDSIKIIALSSGDSIIISKNFGIVQFPHYTENEWFYNLVGVRTNDGYHGIINPTFKEIFDFDIGDQFEYINGTTWGPGEDSYNFENYTITQKIFTDTSFSYKVIGDRVSYYGWGGAVESTTLSKIDREITFLKSDYPYLDYLAYQPYLDPSKPYCMVDVLFENDVLCSDSDYVKIFRLGHYEQFYSAPTSNDPFAINCVCDFPNCWDSNESHFRIGLGRVNQFNTQNTYNIRRLIAYKKGDVICGEFKITSEFLASLEEEEEEENDVSQWFYPNLYPTSIRIINFFQADKFLIYKISGEKVMEQSTENFISNNVNVAHLAKGVYILQLISKENKIINKGLFVK